MLRGTDILCAGELLVDFITADFVQTLDEAVNFVRVPGGSPANLAMNMARLGKKSVLAATVGNDDMGGVLKNYVSRLGVDISNVMQVDEATTIILVTRSAQTSNFQPYRAADFILSIRQFPYTRFADISLFHTTCFALSKKPAQDTLLEAAEKAQRAGVQLSLDVNYSEKIWPNRRDAQRIITEYCRMGSLVKVSEVDWHRLFGEPHNSPEAVIEHFLMSGAKEVCFTLGGEGLWVANDKEKHFIPARPVEVLDTTGAGDAFWAGYLTARLDGKKLKDCALAGRKMAETKLLYFGPLPDRVDVDSIYSDLEG